MSGSSCPRAAALHLGGLSTLSTRLQGACLEKVVTYIDDEIVSHSDPTAHVKTMRALFECPRKHNLKLFPPEGPPGGHRY